MRFGSVGRRQPSPATSHHQGGEGTVSQACPPDAAAMPSSPPAVFGSTCVVIHLCVTTFSALSRLSGSRSRSAMTSAR